MRHHFGIPRGQQSPGIVGQHAARLAMKRRVDNFAAWQEFARIARMRRAHRLDAAANHRA